MSSAGFGCVHAYCHRTPPAYSPVLSAGGQEKAAACPPVSEVRTRQSAGIALMRRCGLLRGAEGASPPHDDPRAMLATRPAPREQRRAHLLLGPPRPHPQSAAARAPSRICLGPSREGKDGPLESPYCPYIPCCSVQGRSVPKLIRERLRQVESGTCALAWLAGETMEDARVTTVRHNQLRRPRQAGSCGARGCGEFRTPSRGEAAVVVDEAAENGAGDDISVTRILGQGLRWQMPQ